MSAPAETIAIPANRDDTSRWRDVLRLCSEVARAKPVPLVALLAVTLIGSARTGVYIAAMGGLTQAIVERDQRTGMIWAGAFALATLIEEVYWSVRWFLASMVTDHAVARIQRRVLHTAASAPLIAFEHGPFYARLQRANDNLGEKFSSMFMALIDTLQIFIMLGSVLVPLWLVSPWIVIVLVVGTGPAFILQQRIATRVHDAYMKHGATDRLLQRLAEILTRRSYAAEIRLFGNGDRLADRWRQERRRKARDVLAAERSVTSATALSQASFITASSICLALTVHWIQDGTTNVGAWVIVLQGVQWTLGIMFNIRSPCGRCGNRAPISAISFASKTRRTA